MLKNKWQITEITSDCNWSILISAEKNNIIIIKTYHTWAIIVNIWPTKPRPFSIITIQLTDPFLWYKLFLSGSHWLDQQWTGGGPNHRERPWGRSVWWTGAAETVRWDRTFPFWFWCWSSVWSFAVVLSVQWGCSVCRVLQRSCRVISWTWQRWRSQRSDRSRNCRRF